MHASLKERKVKTTVHVTLRFVLGTTFQNQHSFLDYTDFVYIQTDFFMIKHTLFFQTYSGSFICESQYYCICFAPVGVH